MRSCLIGFAAVLAAVLLLAACNATGESSAPSETEKPGEESMVESGDELQLLFTDPEGYHRQTIRGRTVYTAGEDVAFTKIILSGDVGDSDIVDMVRNAILSGDYGILGDLMARDYVKEGEFHKVYCGGNIGLMLVGKPAEENHEAIPGGAACLAVIPSGAQLVVVEGYAGEEYGEQVERDLTAFLASAKSVTVDQALEEFVRKHPLETQAPAAEKGKEGVAAEQRISRKWLKRTAD